MVGGAGSMYRACLVCFALRSIYGCFPTRWEDVDSFVCRASFLLLCHTRTRLANGAGGVCSFLSPAGGGWLSVKAQAISGGGTSSHKDIQVRSKQNHWV